MLKEKSTVCRCCCFREALCSWNCQFPGLVTENILTGGAGTGEEEVGPPYIMGEEPSEDGARDDCMAVGERRR